jgi:hypothetical protein
VATFWQNIATGAIVLFGVILSSVQRLRQKPLLQQSPSA